MTNKFSTIQLDAGPDANGEPRRLFVVLSAGVIVCTHLDRNQGTAAIRNPKHRRAFAGWCFEITPAQFRELTQG